MCSDGVCIPKAWACDTFTDCADGADEDVEFCATCPFRFLCTNGRCTDLSTVCNGVNNCRDNSDEDQICVGTFISRCSKNISVILFQLVSK